MLPGDAFRAKQSEITENEQIVTIITVACLAELNIKNRDLEQNQINVKALLSTLMTIHNYQSLKVKNCPYPNLK